MVMESPVLQEIIAEQNADRMHSAIVWVLERRFGSVTDDIKARIKLVTANDRLNELTLLAGTSPDLATFGQELAARSH